MNAGASGGGTGRSSVGNNIINVHQNFDQPNIVNYSHNGYSKKSDHSQVSGGSPVHHRRGPYRNSVSGTQAQFMKPTSTTFHQADGHGDFVMAGRAGNELNKGPAPG